MQDSEQRVYDLVHKLEDEGHTADDITTAMQLGLDYARLREREREEE
jgi:hypothetical protein